MKVFIQSIVAQILLNPYIFWRGLQAPQKKLEDSLYPVLCP